MLSVHNADVYTDLNALAELKNQARKDSPEALKQVARQFESIYLSMVLKSMREASLAEGLLDSDKTRFYRDMYDQQLALHLSGDPGTGLADLIIRQLGPQQPETQTDTRQLADYRDHPAMVSRAPVVADKSTAAAPEKIKLKDSPDLPITSVEQFVAQLRPFAQQAAKQLHVDANLLLAQAALETGWGRAVIAGRQGSSHNLFNIKADSRWNGDQVKLTTLEYQQGLPVQKSAGFRVYRSYQDSFQDYVSFIKHNPRYSEALRQAANPEKYIHGLQQAGYATDPRYADKVLAIYRGETLAQLTLERQAAN